MMDKLAELQKAQQKFHNVMKQAGASDSALAAFGDLFQAQTELTVAMIAEIGIAQEHAHKAAIVQAAPQRAAFVDQHGNPQ